MEIFLCSVNIFVSNLFDIPPFQIDGNLGVTAGIAEMLLQSHQGYIDLLPALPEEWQTGSVKGLCTRGAFEVDINWSNATLREVILYSKKGGSITLRHGGRTILLQTKAGERFYFNDKLELIGKKK